MKVVLICGYFAEQNEKEIQDAARKPVEYSSNNYIRKLLLGFKESGDEYIVLSAPLIGSYPNASSIAVFRGFREKSNECRYVNFLNLWGVRNYSRAYSLKKEIKKLYDAYPDETFRIIVCSVHTPFIESAIYAKELREGTKICLIVPDLPQYMHLDSKPSILYRVAKRIDISRFNRFNRHVDSYVLLTEQMNGVINPNHKPFIVSEGIVQNEAKIFTSNKNDNDSIKNIVYTGKTYEKFGVKNLVDAFMHLQGEDFRLIICGSGDCDDYIVEQATKDKRIKYLGQVPPLVAKKWISEAKVLVNPRQNNEIYTKYSFPSKNLEYLASGNTVVYYLLDGMKKEYGDFAIVPRDDSIEALSQAISDAANISLDEQRMKFDKFTSYIKGLYPIEIYTGIQETLK